MPYIGHIDKCNILNESTSVEVVKLKQNYIVLNRDEKGNGIDNVKAGLVIERGKKPDAVIRFNEENENWEYGVEGDLKLFGKKAVKINNVSFLAKSSYVYLINTSSTEVSVLLPQNPKIGDEVEFIDLKGTFDINNVIIIGNNSKISGLNENFYLDLKYANVKFVYIDSETGWAIAPSNPITLNDNINIKIDSNEIIYQLNNNTQVNNYITNEINKFIIDRFMELKVTENLNNININNNKNDIANVISNITINYLINNYDLFLKNNVINSIKSSSSSNNISNALVVRDDKGNFSANYIDATVRDSNRLTFAKNITLAGAITGSVSFDGSNDVTINAVLNSIDASKITTGTIDAARLPITINSNTNGNAATATKLQTVRTITLAGDVTGSTTFDGSTNVTITSTVAINASKITTGTIDAARLPTIINSNTTGNAATATKLQTVRTITLVGDVTGSATFDGSADITINTKVASGASGGSEYLILDIPEITNSFNELYITSFSGGGTRPVYVDNNGKLTVSASDIKLKSNIKNLNYGLNEILKLRPVSFNWKENNIPDIGLIAQEVEEIIPEIISENNSYKILNYINLIPVLINAIKELKSLIDNK